MCRKQNVKLLNSIHSSSIYVVYYVTTVNCKQLFFFFIIIFPLIFMLAACGDKSSDSTTEDKSHNEHASPEINWGQEVNIDEMIAMARRGQISEIHWYVMPNILRTQAFDGGIFHLRNENKGVDLRNTLINAGVKVGEGGVLFKHFF